MDLDTIRAGLKTVLPTLTFLAKFTPMETDDEIAAWLQKFVDDPRIALDEIAGEDTGPAIRAAIKELLPVFDSFTQHWADNTGVKMLHDFLTLLIDDPEAAKVKLMGG